MAAICQHWSIAQFECSISRWSPKISYSHAITLWRWWRAQESLCVHLLIINLSHGLQHLLQCDNLLSYKSWPWAWPLNTFSYSSLYGSSFCGGLNTEGKVSNLFLMLPSGEIFPTNIWGVFTFDLCFHFLRLSKQCITIVWCPFAIYLLFLWNSGPVWRHSVPGASHYYFHMYVHLTASLLASPLKQ